MSFCPKIGFIHIPKTGGTSISNAFHDIYRLKNSHVSDVKKNKNKYSAKYDLLKGSREMNFAKNTIFISGHINLNKMKLLNRDFIFSYLRDPRDVYFSYFNYSNQRILANKHLDKNVKKLIKKNNDVGFLDLHNLYSGLFSILLAHRPNLRKNYMEYKNNYFDKAKQNKISKFINRSTRLINEDLDFIGFLSDKKSFKKLLSILDIPKHTEFKHNMKTFSQKMPTINISCSKDEFCEFFNTKFDLDIKIYNNLSNLSGSEMLISNEDYITNINSKYELTFDK